MVLRANGLRQSPTLHSYGLRPVLPRVSSHLRVLTGKSHWIRLCRASEDESANGFSHISHKCGFSPVLETSAPIYPLEGEHALSPDVDGQSRALNERLSTLPVGAYERSEGTSAVHHGRDSHPHSRLPLVGMNPEVTGEIALTGERLIAIGKLAAVRPGMHVMPQADLSTLR